jgi:hypothetical protein
MDGYASVCHVAVGDGKGAMVILRRIDYSDERIDCSMSDINFFGRTLAIFIGG